MGTRNRVSRDCDFALGLKMNCDGDIYDVVSGSAPRTAPFTEDQRQELQRQSSIFKYMASSVPVPPELLAPISKTNVGRGSIDLGFSGSSVTEPWRCRRTDGKKWRCSRDVAPEQKYCERHTHKGRPRSRKPVELNCGFTHKNTTIINNNNNKARLGNCDLVDRREIGGLCSFPSSGFEQSRCSEWFINSISSSPNQEYWHQTQRITDPPNLNSLNQNPLLGSIQGLNHQIQTQETIRFIDEIESHRGSVSSSLTLSLSGVVVEESEIEEMGRERSNWTSQVSWTSSDSPPGGPLAEALCLGISSSSKMAPTSSPISSTATTSTGKSSSGDGAT